jgi:poly(3-hydroxybutyrate) depolymerase
MAQAAGNLAQAVQFMRRGVDDAAFTRSVTQIAARLGAGSHCVPSLVIHGSADAMVNPVNAQQLVEQFRLVQSQLDIGGGEPVFDSERWIEGAGRSYRQQQMSAGGRLSLRTVIIEGLGHAWSGGDPRHEYFDIEGPSATDLILEFLRELPPSDAG